jgi:carbonic anhydrase
MESYTKVFENNKAWVASMKAQNPKYFEELAKDQTPTFLYIGCSDSRVPANVILGLEPGEVFVHRNIANLVPNTDDNSQCVIKYAIEVLHVKHVIVCGHYGCGGIKAALVPQDMGILNGWLREIRDVYRMNKEVLEYFKDPEQRLRALVEVNVLEQALNVIKTASYQKQHRATGYPKVHACVFDLETGLLKDLNFDEEKALAKVREVYNLSLD